MRTPARIATLLLFLALATHAGEPVVIFQGSIGLNAGTYRYYGFDVTAEAAPVTVSGRFVAEGGTGNDVEAFIFDADAFTNWKNGHPVKAYYASGRATVGNIAATLPPGGFFLVFSNRFSLVSAKTVEGVAVATSN